MKNILSVLMLLSLLAAGCTSTLYAPDIAEVSETESELSKLPNNNHVWKYNARLIGTFAKRLDLDAGIQFGGDVLDAGLSAATVGLGIAGRGGPMIAYMANAEGTLRRLLGIANPIVRGNALAAGIRALRACRAQFLTDIAAENDGEVPATAGNTLTGAGANFFSCNEFSVNRVIAGLTGAWADLAEVIQSTPMTAAPTQGGGITVRRLLPLPEKRKLKGGSNAEPKNVPGSSSPATLGHNQ